MGGTTESDQVASIVIGGIELSTLLLQAYFKYQEMQNKTEEQVVAELNVERVKFYQRDPAQIPDPT